MIKELLSMHGYGAYVWGAYGLTFFLLCLPIVHSRLKAARLKQHLKRLIQE